MWSIAMTEEQASKEFDDMVEGYRPYATITVVTVDKDCYRIERPDGVYEYTSTVMSAIRIATSNLAEQMFKQATEEMRQEVYESYHKILDSNTES